MTGIMVAMPSLVQDICFALVIEGPWEFGSYSEFYFITADSDSLLMQSWEIWVEFIMET